jgi:CHAT domain-containing protein
MTAAAAAHTMLDGRVGREATCDRLREHLPRHRQVRIYCHGSYDENDPETSSWLQMMPAGPQGRLTPDELQRLDLGRCGILVLGACESGMGERIGRDERVGFVRAALRAGATSVVAATWIAMEPMAGRLLDRFERYLRYLPRDVALQRAQRDAHRGVLVRPEDAPHVPNVRHSAWWSCWTLYGDPGWQTGAGPIRRAVRRLFAGDK